LILLLFNQTDLIDNITRTQREIQILNLINGLELSKSQMDFILEKAQETEQIKNELSKENNNDKITLQILDQLRENRMKNQEIPDELRKMVHYAEKK
jgi:3-deoxy-D-manno-octulosonic acid (KDO) 8-phosphate synthase